MPTEDQRLEGMLSKRDKAERRGDKGTVERLDKKIPTHAVVRADRRERTHGRIAWIALLLAAASLLWNIIEAIVTWVCSGGGANAAGG